VEIVNHKDFSPECIMDLPEADLMNLLYPLGIQHKHTASLKHLAYQIYFQFKNQVPETVEELLMIRGVGHKIALLTLKYAFNKTKVSLLTSLKNSFLLLTQLIFKFSGHSGQYSCSKLGRISEYDRLFECKNLNMFIYYWKENAKRLLGTIEYNFWLSFPDNCQQHHSRVCGDGNFDW